LKPTAYILLLGMAVLLCACPYRSSYPLEAEPSLPIDKNLTGKWAAYVTKAGTGKEEPVKVIIGEQDDNRYTVAITGYVEELRPYQLFTGDSIKGTAFLTNLANRSFLNVRLRDYQYIVEVQWQNGKLSLLPLAENFTGKLIRGTQELRTALEHHCATRYRPTYDENFCLRNMVRVN
jgi:hypothetical protein